MGVGPAAVVRRPPVPAPRHSLVQAARTLDRTGEAVEGRWENGFSYESLGCGASLDAYNPCDATEFGGEDDTINNGVHEPMAIRARHRCATFGWTQTQYLERANAAMEACQSERLAAELWRGTLARSESWENNRYLTSLDSDVLTSGGVTPTVALACLEQALHHDCKCGQRGMIHATAQVATQWRANNLVRSEGGLILTLLDTIVVVDSGYDGSGPQGAVNGDPVAAADGAIWAYATDLVDVRLSNVVNTPESVDDLAAFASGVNRSTNTVDVFAERMAAATWDGCCFYAAQIDLDLCDFAGPGS